jgi:hypothetical protein
MRKCDRTKSELQVENAELKKRVEAQDAIIARLMAQPAQPSVQFVPAPCGLPHYPPAPTPPPVLVPYVAPTPPYVHYPETGTVKWIMDGICKVNVNAAPIVLSGQVFGSNTTGCASHYGSLGQGVIVSSPGSH